MKSNTILFLTLISINFFLLQKKATAQPQLWEIYSTSDQPFINVTVDKYETDSLYVKFMDQLLILHQDSIKYLLKRKESSFGAGFLFGAIIGGIFGVANSSGSEGFFSEIGKGLSIVFGALIGGALGGVISLATGTNEKYQIEKLNIEDKRKLLNKLFH